MKDRKNYRRRVAAIVAISALVALSSTAPLPVARNANVSAITAPAACRIRATNGSPVTSNNDPLAKFLQPSASCPANIFELRSQLAAAGAKLKPALVANRGFHNPKNNPRPVQMMLFEIVSGRLDSLGIEIKDGEFFFGHFVTTDGKDLKVGQGVFIELIAWDSTKEVFNFYELTDDGQGLSWFYRGDSMDIQRDVGFLHRKPDPGSPKFGDRLRCSGCHIAGGPIMKELAAPHNDWATKARPLPFGSSKPDAQFAAILKDLAGADDLAASVKAGLKKLEDSAKFRKAKKALSLQEQLRPLFCPVELNLESDPAPLDDKAAQVNIPSAFFVNPLLAQGSVGSISIGRADYDAALAALRSSFPEALPARPDADHGWLAPVKAFSDSLAIESLIKDGLIDREFAADVLAVDITNPLFSPARCGLLQLAPQKADPDWQAKFKASLKAAAPSNPAAKELSDNLTNPLRDARFHQTRTASFLDQCRQQLQTPQAVTDLLRLLVQRRTEVDASEISKIPQGKILEPGFRIIFPGVNPPIVPKTFRLTEDCKVVKQ